MQINIKVLHNSTSDLPSILWTQGSSRLISTLRGKWNFLLREERKAPTSRGKVFRRGNNWEEPCKHSGVYTMIQNGYVGAVRPDTCPLLH